MKEFNEHPPKKQIINPETGQPVTEQMINNFKEKMKSIKTNEILKVAIELEATKSQHEEKEMKDFMFFLSDLYNEEVKRRKNKN